ncbi:VanZ family protein [Demequina aestuarii]|uniref:VanZ family protein n=1 Tax=Demequina aestuarii TaxID=327095 RepID=UPI000785D92B|nr:VanZ family protein [Demequina aestuarii]
MPNDILDNSALVIAAAAVAAVALAFAGFIGARHGRGTRSVLWTALVLWLLVIAVATLGSTVSSHYTGPRGLSLVPGQEIERGLANERGSHPWLNLVGNVALFVPFGFLAACLVRAPFIGRVATAFIFGLMLSASIEIAQYVLGRVADIDDVILNTSGALAGGVVGALVAVVALQSRRVRAD